MKKLHPGTKWSFRLGGLIIGIFLSLFVGWFIIPALYIVAKLVFQVTEINAPVIISIIITYLILVLIFVEVFARLSYNNWKYEFGDSNLKIERGIIWKHYSNIPYERVQNVDIHRGIFARVFGFSTLQVQTAGFSGSPMSEGHIPGVSIKQADEIREFLMKKITRRSKSGL
mgnify:FL=1